MRSTNFKDFASQFDAVYVIVVALLRGAYREATYASVYNRDGRCRRTGSGVNPSTDASLLNITAVC